jgi:hypothetical protein
VQERFRIVLRAEEQKIDALFNAPVQAVQRESDADGHERI